MSLEFLKGLEDLENDILSLPKFDPSSENSATAIETLWERVKETNPYNLNVKSSLAQQTLTFCLTNNTEEYFKRYITTSLIGYLFRALDEWKVPEGVPVVDTLEYMKDPSVLKYPSLPPGEEITEELKEKYEETKKMMTSRIAALEFLMDTFCYNPDRDVKSIYSPVPIDPSREIVKTPAAKAAMIEIDKKTKLTPETAELKETIRKVVIGRDGSKMKLMKSDAEREDKIASKNYKDASLPHYGYNIIPAKDAYNRFTRYMTQNHDEIEKIVFDVYGVLKIIEQAILPLEVHKTPEEFEAYKKNNYTKFNANIINVNFGQWTMLEPNKENQKAVQIYNPNNRLLEAMQKQTLADTTTGEDLVKKRIHMQKKKNEDQYGKASEAFVNNMRANPNKLVTDFKMANPNSVEAVEEKKALEEKDECPENAVEVGVNIIKNGGLDMIISKMYTEAEAPKAWMSSDGGGSRTVQGPLTVNETGVKPV